MMKSLIIVLIILVGTVIETSTKSTTFSVSIDKAIDSISKNAKVLTIPTYITNHSNDTLYYLSMSCSWQEYFLVNDPKFQVVISECDKNTPIIIRIAPHQSRKVNLELSNEFGIKKINKLKIGYNFIYAKSKKDLFIFNEKLHAKKAIIWSKKYKASR